jgi:hypothetical protein
MWNDLIILGSITLFVLGLGFLISYLRKKQIIDHDDVNLSRRIIEIVELIFVVISKDEKFKNKGTFALDLAKVVVDYIDNILDDDVDKKEVSLDVIWKLLEKFEITPTEEQWQLIEIIVDEGLKLQDKK